MSPLEKLLVNNPLRNIFQKRYEIPLLKELGADVKGKDVLEIGCGSGQGALLIRRILGAKSVHAFDEDLDMVGKACLRMQRHDEKDVMLQVADAARMPFEDARFDAVVAFWVLHHIPEWKKALKEVHRVLKNGGQFIVEEIFKKSSSLWKTTDKVLHPGNVGGFTETDFIEALQSSGFEIKNHRPLWNKAAGAFVCIKV